MTVNMQSKNKRECPFCRNIHEEEFAIHRETRNIGGAREIYQVCCSCGAMGPDGETREEAVELWNRRGHDH
jgi:Lar family restriction alleviation protein